jgi:hypothetical protein
MGIDFSHCDAHWAYSGFNTFRRMLAESCGFCLDDMEGFSYASYSEALEKARAEYDPDGDEEYSKVLERIWNEMIEAEGPKRSWDEIDDPIKPLLNHSDCDGVLTPEECAQVAPRLREIVTLWPDRMQSYVELNGTKVPSRWFDNYDKVQALRLVEGMEKAAAANEELRFT